MTTLVLAAAGGAALVGMAYLALRNAVATVAVLLGVWILTVAIRDTVTLSVAVSTFQVYPADLLAVLLAGIGVARAATHGVRTLARGLALLLFALLAIHVVRGVAQSGLELGLNDGRQWLYFAATLIYAATVPGGWDAKVWRVFVAAGILLTGMALAYIALEGLPSATDVVYRDGEPVTARPLFAAGALVVLQAAILAPAIRWPSRQLAAFLAVAGGLAVVLLQHRTVWVAALVSVGAGAVWWATRQHRESVAFSAVGVALLLVPLAIWAFATSGSLVESVAEPGNTNSTFAWRTTGWAGLISSHGSPSDLVAGDPSGSDWSREIDGRTVDVSAHNGFVDAFIRFGIPGVLLLAGVGLLLWFKRGLVGPQVGLSPPVVGMLLLTQFVYCIAYSLDLVQGLIAGVLIAGLAAARQADRARVSPARPPATLQRA